MPKYNKEVSIWVLAWEDDIAEMSKSKIPVTVTPELETTELQTTLSDDERELTIQGSIRNIDNYPAENIVLSIYADGTKKKHRKSGANGVPGQVRTAGVPLRRRTLYPAEVRRHIKF